MQNILVMNPGTFWSWTLERGGGIMEEAKAQAKGESLHCAHTAHYF